MPKNKSAVLNRINECIKQIHYWKQVARNLGVAGYWKESLKQELKIVTDNSIQLKQSMLNKVKEVLEA